MDLDRTIERIASLSKETFENKHAVMSFAEYLERLAVEPYRLTRNAAQYLRDAFEHQGSYEVPGVDGPERRWRLFDDEGLGDADGRVFGHEEVQNRLYEILCEFVQRGGADRFILLHGPNGSAKSSLVHALMNGLERYSQSDEGPLYRLSWVFCDAGEKEPMGFGRQSRVEDLPSLARADERLITSRIPCEMKDPPFFLLPKNRRREFLEEVLEKNEAAASRFSWTRFVRLGGLSPKNKIIYETLLKSYGGDWRRVVRHIRVERYYISRPYRTAAVSIEPQTTIDASVALLSHGQGRGLPPVLAHETLLEARGDLVDANAGIVEYSDFLKRNPEANKYLLTTAERSSLNLPGMTVSLNLVLCGGTNEKYLASFKRDPSFPSFKGRFELIRVPYLLECSKEAQIYSRHLERVASHRFVVPHTAEVTALWAVLTRLRRPEPSRYSGELQKVVARLGPLDKALFLDRGELSSEFTEKERLLLVRNLEVLRHEYEGLEEEFEGLVDSAYEGRRGASAREMMSLLTELAVEAEAGIISPVQVLDALPRLISDPTLYSFLRISRDGSYHDPKGFIDTVRGEYVRIITDEIQKASDLVDETEYRRLFVDYMLHVKAFGTGEKVVNRQTGKAESPDESLMKEVERHMGITSSVEDFRRDLITKVAAFRLSHPDAPLVFEELFADHFRALERSFYRERRDRVLAIVNDVLEIAGGGGEKMVPERRTAAEHLERRLIDDFGYDRESALQVLAFFRRDHGQGENES